MKKSRIRVVRDNDFFGMARKLKIIIDEKHVADLKYNRGININVKPGTYLIQVKMDWCTSKPEKVKLNEGESAEFKVVTGFDESILMMLKQLYNIFFHYSDFFTLERQKPIFFNR
jgi:hypothetical protein